MTAATAGTFRSFDFRRLHSSLLAGYFSLGVVRAAGPASASLASDRFKRRFDLFDDSVGVLFVEVVPALERRLPTA